MLSHKIPSMFGRDEMIDKDAFLQFGYSFINGLLKELSDNTNEINNQEESI